MQEADLLYIRFATQATELSGFRLFFSLAVFLAPKSVSVSENRILIRTKKFRKLGTRFRFHKVSL